MPLSLIASSSAAWPKHTALHQTQTIALTLGDAAGRNKLEYPNARNQGSTNAA